MWIQNGPKLSIDFLHFSGFNQTIAEFQNDHQNAAHVRKALLWDPILHVFSVKYSWKFSLLQLKAKNYLSECKPSKLITYREEMKSIFPVQDLMGPVINLVSWIKPRGSNAEIYYFIYYSIWVNRFQQIVHSVKLECSFIIKSWFPQIYLLFVMTMLYNIYSAERVCTYSKPTNAP